MPLNRLRSRQVRMQLDARELLAFYDTPHGPGRAADDPAPGAPAVARGRGVAACWLRFCDPLPESVPGRSRARRIGDACPAGRSPAGPRDEGWWRWPKRMPCPFRCDVRPDPGRARLEGADSVRPLMRQLWRVLAPEGRILIVAPNRTSLWAQIERSPFAHGRPFHRGELDRLLKASMFEPLQWDSALYGPPLNGRRLVRSGMGWEKLARGCGRGSAASISSRRRNRSTRRFPSRARSATSRCSRARDVFCSRISRMRAPSHADNSAEFLDARAGDLPPELQFMHARPSIAPMRAYPPTGRRSA